jgi:hypothetical protein
MIGFDSTGQRWPRLVNLNAVIAAPARTHLAARVAEGCGARLARRKLELRGE